jgi:thiamine-phosphate diphosphorylase
VGDLSTADARIVLGAGWIGRSVHDVAGARAAITEGADYLLFGSVFDTDSHPGKAGQGLELLAEVVALGTPVIAIGGVTPERAQSVKDTGAWGVAAIRALWHTPDAYAAAMAMLAPWSDTA